MAEGKKSFIGYCEWIEIFEELDDVQAGKLIKHILRYVNDEHPEAETREVKLCFIPIKQVLKRDLSKYEKYIDKQSVNGSKGGRPRKNPIKPKEEIETQKTQPFLEKPKKTDNVNVNVNVNDNVDEEEKEKNDFNNKLIDIDNIAVEYLLNKRVVNAVVSNKKNKFKNIQHLEKRLFEFISIQKENGVLKKTMADFSSHFRYWHLKLQEKTDDVKNSTSNIPIG